MSILRESEEKQNTYWQERAERLIDAAEKTAVEMIAGRLSTWKDVERSINRQIQAFYGRYATETGLTIAEVQKQLNPSELKAAKDDIKTYYDETEKLGLSSEYKSHLRSLSARAYMSRLEELKVNVQHEIEKLYAEQQTDFKEGLSQTYENTYYESIFNIQQGTGISGSFTALNTAAVDKAVATKWLGDNYSDKIWRNKDLLAQTLETTIPRGIALGQNPRIIGKEINDKMFGAGKNKGKGGMLYRSVNLARTEFNHIANEATYDSYVEADIDKYQFLATLDHVTTKACQDLDLKVYELSERIIGVNYPPITDPPHPCRSTTTAYFPPDEIDEMFKRERMRIARDPETGKAYYVPADMNYEQWRESLTESQGKAFLSAQKMEKHYASDKKQFEGYKKFISNAKKEHGKELVSGLFDGFPSDFKSFQLLKYTDHDKWEIFKDNRQQLR